MTPKKKKTKLSKARRRRMLMFHGQMLLGLFMFILAGGFIAVIVAVNFAAPLLLVKAKHARMALLGSSEMAVLNQECDFGESTELTAGGIFGYDVPRLPDSFRIVYGEDGMSVYVTDAQGTEVATYYGQELSQRCWHLLSEDFGRSVWGKDGETLALTITENPYGGRTRVAYVAKGGVVLAAATGPDGATSPTETPSPRPGQIKPNLKRKIDQGRMIQMQRDVERFEKSFQEMDKAVKQNETGLAKKGVGIPEELKAALKNREALLQKIRTAKNSGELESLATDIDDMGETLKEWGPNFGQLSRLGDLIKKADTSNSGQMKALKRIQSAAKKNPKLSGPVGELTVISNAMNEAYQNSKALAKTDPASAQTILESGFYGRMEEFWNKVAEADTVSNPTQGLIQVQGEIQKNDAKIKNIEKIKKLDPAVRDELKGLHEEIKAARAELQKLLKEKADSTTIGDQAKKLWQLVRDFENLLAEQGQGTYLPKVEPAASVTVDVPAAFEIDESVPVSTPADLPQ